MANFGTNNKKIRKIPQLTTYILRFTIGNSKKNIIFAPIKTAKT